MVSRFVPLVIADLFVAQREEVEEDYDLSDVKDEDDTFHMKKVKETI